MTEQEALKESQRRFGLDAYIALDCRTGEAYCVVGGAIDGDYIEMGRGSTWEDAFADVDRRDRMYA